MSEQGTDSAAPIDERPSRINDEDLSLLQPAIDKTIATSEAVKQAQLENTKAVGALEFVINRLREKYKLADGDNISYDDGTIIRAEAAKQ